LHTADKVEELTEYRGKPLSVDSRDSRNAMLTSDSCLNWLSASKLYDHSDITSVCVDVINEKIECVTGLTTHHRHKKASLLTFDLRYSILLKNISHKWPIIHYKAQTEVQNYDKTLLANFRV